MLVHDLLECATPVIGIKKTCSGTSASPRELQRSGAFTGVGSFAQISHQMSFNQ